jgi:hypothetical protein
MGVFVKIQGHSVFLRSQAFDFQTMADQDELDEEIMQMSTDEIRQRTRHIEEESRYA